MVRRLVRTKFFGQIQDCVFPPIVSIQVDSNKKNARNRPWCIETYEFFLRISWHFDRFDVRQNYTLDLLHAVRSQIVGYNCFLVIYCIFDECTQWWLSDQCIRNVYLRHQIRGPPKNISSRPNSRTSRNFKDFEFSCEFHGIQLFRTNIPTLNVILSKLCLYAVKILSA